MNNSNTSLGFYIPNSDYSFKANKIISREDHIFIITKENEILVYQTSKKAERKNSLQSNSLSPNKYSLNDPSELNRKFILLTHPQTRSKIFDIQIVHVNLGLLTQSKRVIVTISEDLIVNYWNIKDGLCINKINLSNFKRKGEELINIETINERFLIFICKFIFRLFFQNIFLFFKKNL